MKAYSFVTVWRFETPLEKVWVAIGNSAEWPTWWKGVIKIEELKAGDENGVGKIVRSTWKSALPYTLEFDSEVTRVEPMKLIESRAFGELEGLGIWTLNTENENITSVRYDWRVNTTKTWMNWFAPIAKPVFRWNHNVIMNWGGRGLAQKLNCQLLETD